MSDLDGILDEEGNRERTSKRKYQSDNGSELKNKIMKALLLALDVKEIHSRPYNPRTNGKIENRIKEISKKLFSELGGRGVGDVSEEDLCKALGSAVAIMNSSVSSISSYRPYEVRTKDGHVHILRLVDAQMEYIPCCFHKRNGAQTHCSYLFFRLTSS